VSAPSQVPGAPPLTVSGVLIDGELCSIRCAEGVIAALGPDIAPEPGDDLIDGGGGGHVVPPLVNGHTHAAMTLFRGTGGDLPLMRWLQERIWPVEAMLEPEDVYWGARLACLEMARTGTARFWDMYWHPGETARAACDAGLRAVVGGPLIETGIDGGDLREAAEGTIEALAGAGGDAVPSLAPHSIYTVAEESLRWIAERAAEDSLPIQIHLSETEKEVSDCVAEHGMRPAAYLDACGLLGERTILAHGVWLDESELELIAERGSTVVTNPAANMKLAVGAVFSYPRARRAGVAVGIGTDGAGSNDALDLLGDLKLFALAQKHAAGDAEAITAAEAWEVGTGAQAPALGAPGPLAVGAPADFLILRNDAHELVPGDLTEALVYAAAGSVVDCTIVAGCPVMRHGHVPDEEEILARAAERAARLGLTA
jgi:5-methylthioadenosine/S-adenosylhomocysteine deaminase